MDKRIGATVVALAVWLGAASQARAQGADSAPRFSIFGGTLFDAAHSTATGRLTNVEFGGSGDFRLSGFPLTLRSTLAFRQEDSDWTVTPMKFGTLSLDAIGKPVPRLFGAQLYLLGGLGVATHSDYRAMDIVNGEPTSVFTHSVPRETWAFGDGGLGLELRRHLFVQTKMMVPVASQGPMLMPISVGFRF